MMLHVSSHLEICLINQPIVMPMLMLPETCNGDGLPPPFWLDLFSRDRKLAVKHGVVVHVGCKFSHSAYSLNMLHSRMVTLFYNCTSYASLQGASLGKEIINTTHQALCKQAVVYKNM